MNLTIRKGTLADTDNYIALLRTVREGMERKDWFYMDSPAELRAMTQEGILELWVAMDGQRMAGAFHILHPGLSEFNYGLELGLSRDELLRVIHMDSAAVHPDYRGNGLQRRLMAVIEEELSRRCPGAILLTTVHPENLYSLCNVLSLGYTVQKRLAKYGSERYILRKNTPQKDGCL